MSKRKSNKKVRAMIEQVFGCDKWYWHNRKAAEDMTWGRDEFFFEWSNEVKLSATVSLTADQLRGK